MTREVSVVSTVWLELLRAGRPMTYAEITRALPEMKHSNRTRALSVSYRLGHLTRTGARRHYQYSVTPACTIPMGMPLVEVIEATT